MIRSRSIPQVLARATGDGICAVLLVDADGELLGSCGHPPPPPPGLYHSSSAMVAAVTTSVEGGTAASSAGLVVDAGNSNSNINNNANNNHNNNNNNNRGAYDRHPWPLDAASVGALVSEVANDYRRMGEELWLLDPTPRPRATTAAAAAVTNGGGAGSSGSSKGGVGGGGNDKTLSSLSDTAGGGGGGGSSASSSSDKEGSNKPVRVEKGKSPLSSSYDAGTNLKSLIIELDHGVVGVASAGPDFYVVALAEPNAQMGALAGRLRSLGSHVREALSVLQQD